MCTLETPTQSRKKFFASFFQKRSASFACLALILAGCSATTYKPAIDDFATATGKARDGYAALETSVLAAQTERLTQLALKGAQVRPVAGDCAQGSQHCRLEVRPRGGAAKALEPKFGQIRKLMDGIALYGANLQGIVNSDSAAQVSTSVAAVGGSVKTLADTAGATEVSAYAAPSANVLAWIAGEYINQLQVDGLRRATRQANPVIQHSATVLKAAARTAGDQIDADQSEALTAALDAFRAAPTDRAKFDALRTTADSYDAVITAVATDVFGDMAKAHQALTDHLEGRNVSFADVFAAVQSFTSKATTLAGLVQTLAKVKVPAAKQGSTSP